MSEEVPETGIPQELMFENESGRKLVLESLGITERDKALLVTGLVTQITVESKAGDYQSVRAYLSIFPDNLQVSILIVNPAQMVSEDNLSILGQVVKRIGRALDMAVVELADTRTPQLQRKEGRQDREFL